MKPLDAPSGRLALFSVRDAVTASGSPWTPPERLVALCIADHMNGDGFSWPSQRAIATWTGLHRATVIKILQVLCGAGPRALFSRTGGPTKAGDSRASSRYQLNPVPVAQSDRSLETTGGSE